MFKDCNFYDCVFNISNGDTEPSVAGSLTGAVILGGICLALSPTALATALAIGTNVVNTALTVGTAVVKATCITGAGIGTLGITTTVGKALVEGTIESKNARIEARELNKATTINNNNNNKEQKCISANYKVLED